MPTRCAWALILSVCLGCDVVIPLTQSSGVSSAQQLWQRGQEALRDGRPDDSIALYQQSLAADPGLTRNHLSLAAAYLEKGNEEQACVYLKQYVADNPAHVAVHVHLAELLLRLKRPEEARQEFERCIAGVPDQTEATLGALIHCHSELVDLAEAAGDDYSEHLNRGIGLYLLSKERASLAEGKGELSTESLLCKAAAELTAARRQRPDEARPRWYLYEVWSQLAQRPLALYWLAQADEAAPFSYLTPAEGRDLQLAWQYHRAQGRGNGQ